jgi:hypothetical protein
MHLPAEILAMILQEAARSIPIKELVRMRLLSSTTAIETILEKSVT